MRYRHAWPGFLLVASLAVLLGALLAWGDHFLSPGPSGGIRRLLQLWAASRPTLEAASTPAPGEVSASAPDAPRLPTQPDERRPSIGSAAPTTRPDAPAAAVPSESAVQAVPPPRLQPRYALDLGTFFTTEEAERAEAQLNQAGFSTVRFRQQEPLRLFSVFVPLAGEANAGPEVMTRLHQEGFAEAIMSGAAEASVIRIAQAVPLRTAVRIAERLRAAGHEPRVSAEAAGAGQITLRHGTFTSEEEAEAVGREISRLGVPYEVVPIR